MIFVTSYHDLYYLETSHTFTLLHFYTLYKYVFIHVVIITLLLDHVFRFLYPVFPN